MPRTSSDAMNILFKTFIEHERFRTSAGEGCRLLPTQGVKAVWILSLLAAGRWVISLLLLLSN